MNKLYMLLSVVVFVIGALAFSSAAFQKYNIESFPALSFEVTYLRTSTNAKGETRKSIHTRQVQANGEWRETVDTSDKKAVFASTPEGTFSYVPGEQALTRLNGRFPDEHMLDNFRTPAFLQDHPAFAGMDMVAGLEVYVHRENISGTDVELIEKAYSPKTGFSPLRSIIKYRDGSIQVSEAMKVEFKEVPTNDDLKALPVRQQ